MAEYNNGFHCTSLEKHIVDDNTLFLCKVKNERVTFEECGNDCPVEKSLKKGTTVDTNCECGERVTVRTGSDAVRSWRKDGKQVIYTDKPKSEQDTEYDIFRCRTCGKPIHETCKEAEY